MDLDASLARLELGFSATTSTLEKVEKLWQLLEHSKQTLMLRRINGPSHASDEGHGQALYIADTIMQAISRNGVQTEFLERLFSDSTPLNYQTQHRPPLSRLPCANHDESVSRHCEHIAAEFCSACRLVGYCSQTCQKQHWRLHKKDCKNPLREADWQPDWVTEARMPAFLASSPLIGWDQQSSYGFGQSLWGNMPALDIVNAASNEGIDDMQKRDLSLAFVASGDLRHVVRTVNGLPKDYAGRLSICLNDRSPLVVMRNIVLLGVLGLVPDISEAAEHALHIWYSIFLPASYTTEVAPLIHKFLNDVLSKTNATVEFTPSSKIKVHALQAVRSVRSTFCDGPAPSPGQVNDTFMHIMNAPERVDYRHRFFVRLRPSHRMAMSKWRQLGVVLPFGASNVHLATPNRWLIGSGGRFFMNDSNNPLDGWSIDDVIESGQRHGTTDQDIVGCLFYHIRDQLVEFAARLRRFQISIRISAIDARELAKELHSNVDFAKGFDRIEVSNTTDKEYIGVCDVLKDWGPLLRQDNKHAAIIGTFMNWVTDVPSSHGASLDSHVSMRHISNIIREHYMDDASKLTRTDPRWGVLAINATSSMDLKLENSAAFLKYLKKYRADETAHSVGLRRRQRNKIVAPRPFTELGNAIDALPDVNSPEKWYRASALSNLASIERYVEWVQA